MLAGPILRRPLRSPHPNLPLPLFRHTAAATAATTAATTAAATAATTAVLTAPLPTGSEGPLYAHHLLR